MGALLKERARKPIIPSDVGIVLPLVRWVDGVRYFVADIREPWNKDGYQSFSLLLTEKEMLGAAADWLKEVAKTSVLPTNSKGTR